MRRRLAGPRPQRQSSSSRCGGRQRADCSTQDHAHCAAPPSQCNTYADFKYEKTMLQWLAYERGHRVIYGVRFHCECAVVEAMWAYIVSKLRQEVDGKSSTLVVALVEKLAYGI